MRVRFTAAAFMGSLWLAGCNSVDRTTVLGTTDDTTGATPAPSGLNEPLTMIAASTVVSGFKHGRLRRDIDVAGFSISKHPITVGQYSACMDASACTKPAHDCTNLGGTESPGTAGDAALCVGEDNARAYCAWSGGRLPALSEWLLAARGRSPQRFSWGDGSATCGQHALAHTWLQRTNTGATSPDDSDGEDTSCVEPNLRPLEIGKHSSGASPSGLEDVLIAQAELLGGHLENHFSVCERSDRSCIVYGLLPGAIDAVKPTEEKPEAVITHPYTFRCVWAKEGS